MSLCARANRPRMPSHVSGHANGLARGPESGCLIRSQISSRKECFTFNPSAEFSALQQLQAVYNHTLFQHI